MRASILAVLVLLAVAGALRAQTPAVPTANTSPTRTGIGIDGARTPAPGTSTSRTDDPTYEDLPKR